MCLPDNRGIACCRDGDMELLSQVYALHGKAVFLHAYYLLGLPEEADNVKQETFMRAYRAMCKLRKEDGWKTWLLKTCTDLCRDKPPRRQGSLLLLRFRRKERHTPAEIANEDLIANAEQASASEIILRALRQMPLEPRNLIALSELEGYTPAEIASIVGCDPESIPSRLSHARRLLQENIYRASR